MAEKTAKKMGRPSKYTPELAAEICERLSNGEPLRKICRDDHMPFWTRIYDWMGKDEQLSIAIAHAREAGQDAIAEEIYLETVAQPERILFQNGDRIDPGYVALVKARAEIKLKLLAKWNPKRYGDRVQVAGDPNAPLKTEISFDTFATVIETLEARRQDKANG
jgi:hypothetical protein